MEGSDRAFVERQLGRPPRAFRRVAVRCPFGRPAVAEQAPVDEHGAPFPTQFWVTCPHLVAQLARVEAGGGVERWTRAAATEPLLARSLDQAHAQQRALRPELPVGIGGASRTGSLKCLHAHAAFALARPGYELGDLILADAAPLWPPGGCCTPGASDEQAMLRARDADGRAQKQTATPAKPAWPSSGIASDAAARTS